MGTTQSQSNPTEGQAVESQQPNPSSTSTVNPVTEKEDNVDASHPRNHVASKEAFARVAAADETDKNSILSAELASAEALAEVNLAQFFDALESRCETDEEREALKKLIKHRREEQERWKLAQTGQDPNSLAFPTGNYDPPKVPANSLDWWVGLPSAGGARDVNENAFPLRHFEVKGEADQATQEEVTTTAESLREDLIKEGDTWVKDELADGEVVNNKELSWKMTPVMEAMTDDEMKFLNSFWERRGLAEDAGDEKEFTTTVETAGAWAPSDDLKDVISNDVTTPDQEAVIKLRETRGKLKDDVRKRRVQLLAKHFAEREEKKQGALEAKGIRSPKKAESASVPSSAFFEERLEVATEESTQAQKANRLAQEEAAINKLAEEGSKYTTFGEGDVKSPKADGEEQGKDSAGFPFTSPEAKARVDAIIARREKERTEPSRDAPKPPPAEVEVTPPPPPSEP